MRVIELLEEVDSGMSQKERMLQALRGNTEVGVPFAPRLDIWYNSHLHNRTMPDEFAGLDLSEIVRRLGCANN